MLELSARHQPIARVIEGQLDQVTVVFERQLASDLSAVNRLCLHIEEYRGKMLRPTLVILSGLACRDERGDEPGDEPEDDAPLTHQHRVVAAVAEMIHMATLVHDDVLDEAEIRRRGATVNHLWGNETAVMLGDYLISNAFHLCSTIGEPSINLALGEVTNTLCEGELMQLHHRDDYGLTEETYFEIVRRKTASLIGECCRLGALLSGASVEAADALHRYGEAMGIAFQIRDDLLDVLGEPTIVGKSLGTDLGKGKLTLPIIHCIQRVNQADRGQALRLLEKRDAAGIRRLLDTSGAVEVTQRTANELVAEAKACLPELKASPARDLLEHFADTVVSRSF